MGRGGAFLCTYTIRYTVQYDLEYGNRYMRGLGARNRKSSSHCFIIYYGLQYVARILTDATQ